jgi:hypothetical protein
MVVSYSFRAAGAFVAWVHEENSDIMWYSSGPPGEVAPWIADALAAEGWMWRRSR